MKPRDEHKVELVYQATCRLAGRVGIAGLTMATIAREAGLATGTLYIYFANKEELLHALYRHVKQKLSLRLFQDLHETDPLDSALRKIWLNYLHNRLENHEESVFQEQFYTSPYLQAEEIQMSLHSLAPLFQLFNRGKEARLIQPLDNALLAVHLLGSLRDLASLIRLQQPDNAARQQLIAAAFRLCWQGMKA